MCGVNVIASWGPAVDAGHRTGGTAHQRLSDVVEVMNQRLAHRGPDTQAVWSAGRVAIGHTRLKIIDPDGGQQPRVSASQVLSFNGEIYNYRQLRAELLDRGRTLRDDSDTEVLAVALETWGIDAVERLNGDFAFVVYDLHHDTLLLCRDRLGVKPLHFALSAHEIVVSSEPKGILAAQALLRPGHQPQLDRTGLLQTLLYGSPIPPITCFEGIQSVRGGELVTIRLRTGAVERRRYWELGDTASDPEGAHTRIADLLTDAINLRRNSDVDYALLLSGGVDSSLIAYLVGDLGGKTRAYTIGEHRTIDYSSKSNMTGSDLDFAELVAEQSGQNLAAFDVLGGSAVEYVRKCTRARDALVTLANDLPMLKLFERIQGQDTVVLSGEGADETFLGYFYNTDTSAGVGPYFSSPRARTAFALLNPRFVTRRAAARIAQERFDADLSHLPASIRSHRLRLMHYLQLRFTLPFVLDRADRLSASRSLELRVPYCDHRLVEYVFGLDDSLTFTDPEKRLLRDSFSGRFDDRVLYRRKSVFPFAEDDAQLQELRAEARRIIAAARRDGGLVADVYRLPWLAAVFASDVAFGRLAAWLGSFYTQAFLCQVISLHELEQEYGVRAVHREPGD